VHFPERFWNSKEMVDLRTKKHKGGEADIPGWVT